MNSGNFALHLLEFYGILKEIRGIPLPKGKEAVLMARIPLQIQMLGDFSISCGAAAVSSGSDRSKKLWLLIAYLIYRRGACVPQEELIELLWGGNSKGSNPPNALKTLFHRARALLNRLDGPTGRELLLRSESGYAWNAGVPVEVDVDRFAGLCQSAANTKDGEVRLARLLEAAELYQGDFLEKLSTELWVVPIAAYYHSLYVDCAREALALLEARKRWTEAAELCRAASRQEPCSEEFCLGLMTALIHTGRQNGAIEVYAKTRERLMSELGVPPSDEIRELYQTALLSAAPQALSFSELLVRLQEAPSGGAMICDFDFFRTICHASARMAERTGDAAHLALISVAGSGSSLPSYSLERVMDHLQEILRSCLRRGDAAARCSASQFAVLLPQANYENSLMVCQRIDKAFTRQYPHSPARLHTDIQPLDPAPSEGRP